jgi:hypothetical protein
MHYSIIEGKRLALLLPHIQEVLGSNHLTLLMLDVFHGFLQSFQSRYLTQDHNNSSCLLLHNPAAEKYTVKATEHIDKKSK